MLRLLACLLLATFPTFAQDYAPSTQQPPPLAREFRAAWIATVYNIDWPSAPGLSAETQQAQLRAMLDKLAALKLNAVVFQVRPQCDALYASATEPWSRWLTGAMGRSPGYDPLAFCIREAHARGIEVHAWFNPFRALCNTSHTASSGHVTRTAPGIIKRYGAFAWCDPAAPESRARALAAISDVVKRYDVDGIHLDDYFYPYPEGGREFPDGKSPAQRRAIIDDFVRTLYTTVKKEKPWVRVGISPFGIWRPGVPGGIEAGLDSYEQLACDSRLWLAKGWVDYLAPQLYWRISPQKQSFPLLLDWWRRQGARPVWPGIATSRIASSEDPGRPAGEIINQIALTRTIGKNWKGHLHWSAKALVTDRGGIAGKLAQTYTRRALVPPMPWLRATPPTPPRCGARIADGKTNIRWLPAEGTGKIVIQALAHGAWDTVKILPAVEGKTTIPRAEAIALTAVDRYGNASAPKVLALP